MSLNLNIKYKKNSPFQIAFFLETVLNLFNGDPNFKIYYLVCFLNDFYNSCPEFIFMLLIFFNAISGFFIN
jgi:hypothetical protein